MAERSTTTFEARLEAAFAAYADEAPVAVTPAAVARAAAEQRSGLHGWLGRPVRVLRPAVMLAILVALLLASLVVSATWRLPSPTPALATRLIVSDGLTVRVLGPDGPPGSERQVMASGDWTGRFGCPTVIAGTLVMAAGGFGTWDLVDLAGGPAPQVRTSIDYAGFERWSPDRTRVMMGDLSGTLTVADFTDPSKVREPAWPVPGMLDAAWSTDGSRIAVARASDGPSVIVDLIDVVSGSSSPLGTYLVREAAITEVAWAPDDRRLLLLRVGGEPDAPVTTLSTIDLADPRIRPLRDQVNGWPGTLEAGYLSVHGPLAWSPDSRRLAIVPGESTVVTIVGPDAPVTVDLADLGVTGPVTAIGWSADGRRLAVQVPAGLVILAPDGAEADLRLPGAQLDWGIDGDALVVVRLIDDRLHLERLAWDATEPVPIADWPAVGRSGDGPTACLEVQTLRG